MDESAQQAVQLGVNVTIFILALTLSITLLLEVRDVAKVASDYNASIPTGSRVVSVAEQKQRVISGNELLSYYVNYMIDVNHERTERYTIIIQDGSNELKEEIRNGDVSDIADIKKMFKDKHINLAKDYELITEKYDKGNDHLLVRLKAIN